MPVEKLILCLLIHPSASVKGEDGCTLVLLVVGGKQRVPVGNPCRQEGEHANSTQKRTGRCGIETCEVTVLTTVPTCRVNSKLHTAHQSVIFTQMCQTAREQHKI